MRWQDVRLWDRHGQEITGAELRRALLAEYRCAGAICDVWLADPADTDANGEIGGVPLCDCGSEVGEIDWAGFED